MFHAYSVIKVSFFSTGIGSFLKQKDIFENEKIRFSAKSAFCPKNYLFALKIMFSCFMKKMKNASMKAYEPTLEYILKE